MAQPRKRHIESVDAAKGILLINVLISHVCGFRHLGDFFCASYIYAFFVLAGYTCSVVPPQASYWALVKGKAKRLLIPFAAWNGVIIAVDAVRQWLGGAFAWKTTLKSLCGAIYARYCLYPLGTEGNVIFLDKNGALWFVPAFFLGYVIFYGAMRFARSRPGNGRAYEAMLGLLAASVLLTRLPILLPWSLDTAFFGAFLMMAGYLLKRGIGGKTEWFRPADRAMIALGFGVLYMMLVRANDSVNMSVRVYGDFGDWSVLLSALIGPLGAFLYVAFAKALIRLKPLKYALIQVSRAGMTLIALQFEVDAILKTVLPLPAGFDEYYFALLLALANLLICVLIDAAIRWVKGRITRRKVVA